MVDGVVARTLGPDHVREMGGWAPKRPAEVTVPIGDGAGQYRAIGRVITLSRNAKILETLSAAWTRLHSADADNAIGAVAHVFPEFGAPGQAAISGPNNSDPIVLVVSSAAGGAGASMALDVCRTLARVPGLNPSLTAVFLYAPDVFDDLEEDVRLGARANALAMLGEVVAAQTGAGRPHDSAVLGAFGLRDEATVGAPFARVFPVGARIGSDGARLAETHDDLYRALGRGLAALVTSGDGFHEFGAYDLGNPQPLHLNGDYFGWGVSSASQPSLAWKSFGFATLSMGRDRYRHYASQRLAREAVDRLVDGHLSPGSETDPQVQLDELIGATLDGYLAILGLPARDQEPAQWLRVVAVRPASYVAAAREILTRTIPVVPQVPASATPATLKNQFANLATRFGKQVDRAAKLRAYALAYDWHRNLFEQSVSVFEKATAQFGFAYARALIGAATMRITQVVSELNELSGRGDNPYAEPPEISKELAEIRNQDGVYNRATEVMTRYWQFVEQRTAALVHAHAAPYFAAALSSYAAEVLDPLSRACAAQLRALADNKLSGRSEAGLANWDTDSYADWPSGKDDSYGPDARWDQAVTEVLVTASAQFPGQYLADLTASAAGWDGSAKSKVHPAAQVIEGRWQTAGRGPGSAAETPLDSPGRLIEVTGTWHSTAFKHAADGAIVVPQKPQFAIHASLHDLRARALEFVGRAGFSFEKFASLGFADYLAVTDLPAEQTTEQPRREALLERLFRQTLARAKPLVGIDIEAAQLTVTGADSELDYKFSALPFANSQKLAANLSGYLASPEANVSAQTSTRFSTMLGAAGASGASRVSIFSSHQRLAPLAYSSLLAPIADEWGTLTVDVQRQGFWQWRASRPLSARLPMSDLERRAMVMGWFISEVIGDLWVPRGSHELGLPVKIYYPDPAGKPKWLNFPHPLLTPPNSPGFTQVDWLPAVLESVLLAHARATWAPKMASLGPYRALRSAYDAGPTPATGMAKLSGVDRLASWLACGYSPSGGESWIEHAAALHSPRERAEAVKDWIGTVRSIVGRRYLPCGVAGAPGGGKFSSITTRQQASDMPFYCEVAEDAWICLSELNGLIETALKQALTMRADQLPLQPDSPDSDRDFKMVRF
jgi:hypothetical protein